MLVSQNSKRHPEFIEQGVRIDLCGCDTLTSQIFAISFALTLVTALFPKFFGRRCPNDEAD